MLFRLTLFSLFLAIGYSAQAQNGLPTNPDPNKCYVRCVTPDVYQTEEVRVMTRPAYKRMRVVPAKYENRTETVVVKEASTRYEVVPATYRTETVSYQSEEPYNKLAIREASFTDATETVEVTPATARWEYTPSAGCESDDPNDCQVLCYRNYDAQSTTVSVKRLGSVAATTKTQVGGNQATYTKRVIDQAASVREIAIPAVTETITKRVLVEDEKTMEEEVPAEYTTVTREVLKTKGGLQSWAEIDCALTSFTALPINYASGSASLDADSRRVIDDRLLKLLNDQPNVRIQIDAHTDSRGGAASNQTLSERRAQSVVNYLIGKGINRSRLVAKGYGESRLKNRCADGVTCSESEHAANRRTEFVVLNN